MARKDEIFLSFVAHETIQSDYHVPENEMPRSLLEGLKSKHPIIKTIAFIVQDTEAHNSSSEKALYEAITKFLNISAS